MLVLGLDTATAATTVALLDTDGSSLELRDDPAPGARPGHASQLLPLVHQLLQATRVGWSELDRIAVGVGPGTFTGLRIGLATAQALAASAGKPLVGISTLEALAAAAPDTATLAVIDARRGEAFAAAWLAGGGPRGDFGGRRGHRSWAPAASHLPPPALEPSVLTPDELGAAAERLGPLLALGDGAIRFRDVLEHAGAQVPADHDTRHRVSALQIGRLAVASTPGPAADVEPLYLRAPDAELNLKA